VSFLKQKIGDIFMSHPVYAQNHFVLRVLVLVPVLFLFFLLLLLLRRYVYMLINYSTTNVQCCGSSGCVSGHGNK